jgi:primosomal protein N' (replication factor Y)
VKLTPHVTVSSFGSSFRSPEFRVSPVHLVSVAVPIPAVDALTYRVPGHLPVPVAGARVLVPLGSRVLTGVVLEAPDGIPPDVKLEDIKNLIDVLDDGAFLSADVLKLVRWVSEYYACGVGEALASAMPPRAWIESERHATITDAGRERRGSEKGLRREILDRLSGDTPVRVDSLATRSGVYGALAALEKDGLVEITRPLKGTASAFRTVRVARLTAQGHEFLNRDSDGESTSEKAGHPIMECPDSAPSRNRLGPKQQEALERLRGEPDGVETAVLAADGISAATMARLARLGLVSIERRRIERDPFEHGAAVPSNGRKAVTLTDEQSAAFDRLRTWAESGRFECVLLHGVTGSGKTELYLRLAECVRRSGRGVLLLVPEIALTPAVAALFRATFGERVAIQHSGLSDGERHDQWHRIRRGDVDVVVGTRSAVFAPVKDLGLIIVDEEHDGSYKQEETPRYHGRDVAVVRAHQAGALVVLGSATPSMESFHNAQTGRYKLISLQRRVLDRPLAEVRIVDMRQEYAAGGPDVILSEALRTALRERLERREQAIVLLNRRGFATVVFCRQCAHTLECPNCSVSLTVHKAINRARCHYCNHSITLPPKCVKCSGPYLEQVGFGTERVEAEIKALLPDARVARVDRDTIRRRGAIADQRHALPTANSMSSSGRK